MADNPNYNWDAWNEISIVEEHVKELRALMQLVWRDVGEHSDLRPSISALIRFTDTIEDHVIDIGEMVGPEAPARAA
jgi:hypothetical protein